MNCPKCGVWTQVIDTRGDIRVRKCANMHRFTTREMFLYDHEDREKAKEERRRQIAMEPGTQVVVAAKYGVAPHSVALYRRKYLQEDK